MIGLFRITKISAVLAAAIVATSQMTLSAPAVAPGPAVEATPVAAAAAPADCAAQAWPHVSPDCISDARPRRKVRVIALDAADARLAR
ncbi:MAG TPA: hypothetical protein VM434_11285 [Beijerinckiaceae bacterium]|nr:hypothetical protein [Beijerinckiaceae bacterium]